MESPMLSHAEGLERVESPMLSHVKVLLSPDPSAVSKSSECRGAVETILDVGVAVSMLPVGYKHYLRK